MFQVNLLGSFDIAVNGRRVHSDLGPSGQRMAGYLFTYPGQKHARERLADLFWPKLTLDRSRGALNSALWRIRKLLAMEPASAGGRNLGSFGSEIVLDPAPWLQVDIQILEAATRATRGVPHGLEKGCRIDGLREAFDLYRRPFLEQEEDDWILEERERIHTAFVKVCLSLINEYLDIGEYDEAIVVCRRVLSYDPFRELFVRYLLALLCLSERRAEAMRFFQRWQVTLKEELGIEPMPPTIDVVTQITRCETNQQVDCLRHMLSSACGAIIQKAT